jgi:PAS domain S-box-containing protein
LAIHANVTLLKDENGEIAGTLGVLRDITERKQAEEALRNAKDELEQRVAERTAELSSSRARLSMIFRTSPAGIFLTRLEDGMLLEVNDTCGHILGYSAEEMIGRTTLELGIFVNPDDRKRSTEILKREGRNENIEMQYRHKSGRTVHLLINALPVNVDGVPCILGTTLDITERKHAEQAMRTIAHKLIAVREEERRRVATDLHDSLAQGLVALKLAMAASNFPSALEQCDRLIHEVREISQGLYPAVLERLGLAEGLTQLAEAYEPSISVTVDYAPELADARFDKDLEIALYRVAQEAINNAIRHGKAGQIEVELALSDGQIGLSVSDDGGGFDVAGRNNSGLGLMTMKDRVSAIGGTLDITSQPGQTVVRATVPLPKNV